MGCGCGKRKTVRTGSVRRVSGSAGSNSGVSAAKVFQSATVKAPQGPVTKRKTV